MITLKYLLESIGFAPLAAAAILAALELLRLYRA
jgi:hypothetical protein